MRAVVLVGGLGTRLRPLTYTIPKPMLPVVHVPIIERLIGNLARGGVTEVVMALGFKPEPFLEAFPDGTCAGTKLLYAVEPEPLDTAGAIRFAADAAEIEDTFVVANGDILTDLDVAELVAFHRSTGAEGTIHLIPVDDPSAFGVVGTDDEGRVTAFVEKPAPGTQPSNLINAGTYVLEPSMLRRVPSGRKVSIERVTFPQMVASGTLFALPRDVYWIDTGRPESYLQANLDRLDRADRRDALAIDRDADVDPSARIERSVVAAGARVGAGATIEDSVILGGADIGAESSVVGSVVAGMIGAHASVAGSVIGAHGVVQAATTMLDARIPSPS